MTETNFRHVPAKAGHLRLLRIAVLAGAVVVLAATAVAAMAASPSISAREVVSGQLVQAVEAGTGFGRGHGGLGQGGLPGTLGGWTSGGGGRGFGGHHRGVGFSPITITAISGSNLSLKTDDGWTRTIAVTSSTRITKGGETIAVGDLAVGDQIRFSQTRNADGTDAITAIVVVVPQVAGTVSAVTDASITITDRSGLTRTITTTASTTYKLGPNAGSRSDVKVGVGIVASGTVGSDTAFTATSVTVLLPRVAGEVTAKDANTITIRRGDGTSLVVHVDGDTTYSVPGVTNPTLEAITVGMRILAEGTQNADGSLDAVAVYAGRGLRGHGWGPLAPAPSPTSSSSSS